MALSFKSNAVDALARELASVTGETMTRAVEVALQERLEREKAQRLKANEIDWEGVREIQAWFKANADTRPVTEEEWDRACGEDDLQREIRR